MRHPRRIALTGLLALGLALGGAALLAGDAPEAGSAPGLRPCSPVGAALPKVAPATAAARSAEAPGPEASTVSKPTYPAPTGARGSRPRHAAWPAAPGPSETSAAAARADALGGTSARAAEESSAPAIELEPAREEPVGATFHVTGWDPLGPRPLVLWRRSGIRWAVTARGASEADGTLRFPRLRVPSGGLELAASAAGRSPVEPGASEILSVPGRSPEPPRATLRGGPHGERSLRIVPSEATGAVVVADPQGVVLNRFPLAGAPDAAARSFEVFLDVEGPLLLAHEWPDGRRSEWRAVAEELAEPVLP